MDDHHERISQARTVATSKVFNVPSPMHPTWQANYDRIARVRHPRRTHNPSLHYGSEYELSDKGQAVQSDPAASAPHTSDTSGRRRFVFYFSRPNATDIVQGSLSASPRACTRLLDASYSLTWRAGRRSIHRGSASTSFAARAGDGMRGA